jgi:hypothetical protein
MKQFLIRDKFKTELGKQIFDLLIGKAPDLSSLYFLFTSIIGDERKKILLDFLNEKERTWDEIDDFVDEKFND